MKSELVAYLLVDQTSAGEFGFVPISEYLGKSALMVVKQQLFGIIYAPHVSYYVTRIKYFGIPSSCYT